MMTLVESIARKHNMSALMLTVFKHNPRALSFYLDKLRCAHSSLEHALFITPAVTTRHKEPVCALSLASPTPSRCSNSYDVDETSPSQCGSTKATYEILSKRLSEVGAP